MFDMNLRMGINNNTMIQHVSLKIFLQIERIFPF